MKWYWEQLLMSSSSPETVNPFKYFSSFLVAPIVLNNNFFTVCSSFICFRNFVLTSCYGRWKLPPLFTLLPTFLSPSFQKLYHNFLLHQQSMFALLWLCKWCLLLSQKMCYDYIFFYSFFLTSLYSIFWREKEKPF